MSDVLASLLERLRGSGGRYLLSVGMTREERDAQPEPSYGGKGYVRWLTDDEYAAFCAIETRIAALEAQLAEREWRPIDSAPDDVPVLLYTPQLHETNPERVEVRPYRNTRSGSCHAWATHWMPLPQPPKEAP